MKGWQILKHSLRQVFGNLNGALRVSAVLYAVQVAVGLALGVGVVSQGGMGPGMMSGGLWFGFAAALLVAILTSLWIAVSWHRFVLLGENAGFVPVFRGDRIWAYLLRSLGYGLILLVVFAVGSTLVMMVLRPVLMGIPWLFMLATAALIYLPVLVIGFRLTADLPGAALGADVPFLAGWRATQGKNGEIAAMAVILIVLALAVEILGTMVFGMIPVVNLLWGLAIGWVQMMVGVSVLTTLYGHYIEKRALV